MDLKYITKNDDLDNCITFLNTEKEIAIDLEFDKNRYRYGFNLCLIQIFANNICFIIDPLSNDLDVKRLYPTLENPQIVKVVYSFGEDFRLLHSLGCFPQNTYDIAITLRLLNYPPASLASTLYKLLDVEINKSAQKSNWYFRPLSDKQIDYAAKDVLYLLECKKILEIDAEKHGVSSWINEENSVFDNISFANVENNIYVKEKDKNGLTEHAFHIFKKLLEFRENIAKKYNRPSYQIIDKEYLKELAERPNQIHRFHKIKGIYKSLRNDPFKDKLNNKRKDFENQADVLGLSKTEKASKRQKGEDYLTKRRKRTIRDQVKKKIFKPIQKLIIENHGENVVTYILSNRLMDELATGNVKNLRNYKRKLFEMYAKELDLDVSPYLNGNSLGNPL